LSLDHITPKTLESHADIGHASFARFASSMRLPRSNLIFKELRTSHRCEALKTPASLERLTPRIETIVAIWWSQGGSNSRPPACKAGALPAELWPRSASPLATPRTPRLPSGLLVGLAGVEPATSPLSGVRSNQLSYRPNGDPMGPQTLHSGNLCGCSDAPQGLVVLRR
jgi:hypothetical protein